MKGSIGGLGLALLCIQALACADSKPVDIGDNRPAVPLGASLSDYAGAWEGYAEAYEWNDGSDRLRITLDADGNGALEVGESAELPAPDPDTSYPPGSSDYYDALMITDAHPLIAGFSYTIADATVSSNRIQLGASTGELYSEWCALQTPMEVTNIIDPSTGMSTGGNYACVSTSGFGTLDNGTCVVGPNNDEPVDCGKLACLSLCACTADSCSATRGDADVELDAALEEEGEELAGTLVLRGERVFVRMNRL